MANNEIYIDIGIQLKMINSGFSIKLIKYNLANNGIYVDIGIKLKLINNEFNIKLIKYYLTYNENYLGIPRKLLGSNRSNLDFSNKAICG